MFICEEENIAQRSTLTSNFELNILKNTFGGVKNPGEIILWTPDIIPILTWNFIFISQLQKCIEIKRGDLIFRADSTNICHVAAKGWI